MINVLISDNDKFYVYGLKKLLEDLFHSHYGMNVNFLSGFNEEVVSQSDVIILGLCKGERFTCIRELKFRTRGIIIGVTDKEAIIIKSPQNCVRDIDFIERTTALNVIRERIIALWEKRQQNTNSSCSGCKHKSLTNKQVNILTGIYQGKTISQLATELNQDMKVIFSNKYIVMKRFNLRGDYDLFHFMRKVAIKNIIRFPTYGRTNQ